MFKKINDNLGQTQPSKDQFDVNYHKSSTVEFWISHGIPSKNTTHEKLDETSLMLTN